MKTVRNLALATVLLSELPLLAKVARIPELPPSGFADTEEVTNIARVVRRGAASIAESVVIDAQGPSLMFIVR